MLHHLPAKGKLHDSRSMSIANTGLESPRGTLYKNSLRNQAFTQGSNPLGACFCTEFGAEKPIS